MSNFRLAPAVLIIEDEATQRKLLSTQLEKSGFKILAAKDGKKGLDLWRENQQETRIVITDLQMPDVDGISVIRTIRSEEKYYTFIMALTQSKDKETLLKVLASGADDYVHKPIILEELHLRMQAAIRMLRLQDHHLLISGMAELAAERSGETANHLRRVKQYSYILALELCNGADLQEKMQLVEDITNLSVLHDIGKTSLPDGLLNKRTKRTPREEEMYKEHTQIGGDILYTLYQETGSPFLLTGHEIAMYHHEHWDGNGYPNGLQGEEIPLAARIVGFADVYDSMLSRKAYKDALPLSYVEDFIVAQNGKRFDPKIVDCYHKRREQFLAIQKEISDRDLL